MPWGELHGVGNWQKLEGTEPTLEEMEDALDRQYYSHALKVSKGRDSNIHLMKFIKTEIDHRNIINQFRELRQNISPDKRLQMVIPGGRISQSVMAQVSQATSSEGILDALRRSKGFGFR